MQFLSIDKSTTLAQLSNRVGARNIDSVLHLNQLSRVPNIGQAFQDLAQATMSMTTQSVGWQTKSSILNTMTGDSDVFEAASLLVNQQNQRFQISFRRQALCVQPPFHLLKKAREGHSSSVCYGCIARPCLYCQLLRYKDNSSVRLR